jgi:hypothetical protein
MRDATVFVHYLGNRDPAELAGIERLAARGWIEGRPIQVDTETIRTRVHYASPEFRQIAVVIIKAVRH